MGRAGNLESANCLPTQPPCRWVASCPRPLGRPGPITSRLPTSTRTMCGTSRATNLRQYFFRCSAAKAIGLKPAWRRRCARCSTLSNLIAMMSTFENLETWTRTDCFVQQPNSCKKCSSGRTRAVFYACRSAPAEDPARVDVVVLGVVDTLGASRASVSSASWSGTDNSMEVVRTLIPITGQISTSDMPASWCP
jgi:hypothetical protein